MTTRAALDYRSAGVDVAAGVEAVLRADDCGAGVDSVRVGGRDPGRLAPHGDFRW